MDLKYWLVRHPKIFNFSWQPGQTFGSSTLFPFLAVILYLLFTYLLPRVSILPSLSPKLMKVITTIHNMFLISLSSTIAVGCTLSMLSTGPDLNYIICYPPNTKPNGPLFFWSYIFYLSKVVEFIDTLLIIVGKSFKRLSFLHVFHHSAVVPMCWIAIDTSQSSFTIIVFVNSWVHVIMYTYYLLCSMGIRPKWKRNLTDCQITQFVSGFIMIIVLVYYHVTGSGCSGLWSWCWNALMMGSLYFLFQNFRTKAYSTEKSKASQE